MQWEAGTEASENVVSLPQNWHNVTLRIVEEKIRSR